MMFHYILSTDVYLNIVRGVFEIANEFLCSGILVGKGSINEMNVLDASFCNREF